VFNAFGPDKSFRPATTWAVSQEAHAEWFIPTRSGNLSEIQVAVTPAAGTRNLGKVTLFLNTDDHGFPGKTIESFSVRSSEATNLLTLESATKAVLRAGVKYWLGARSKGGWVWHFNDQNIVHNSARLAAKKIWASAGDYCYIGAFSIRITTNQPAAKPIQSVAGETTNPAPETEATDTNAP
jgi:hypothetical protein